MYKPGLDGKAVPSHVDETYEVWLIPFPVVHSVIAEFAAGGPPEG